MLTVSFETEFAHSHSNEWCRVGNLYSHVTRRALARANRTYNRARRAWLLAIGREQRALMRLDPPCDYDDIPF